MAPISLVIAAPYTGRQVPDSEVVQGPIKMLAQKTSKVLEDEEEQTTDLGESCASETESSSGLSCNEGSCNPGRSLGKRCRFGRTPLETIPATPSAAAVSLGSPPGFSRAAMRQARDACKSKPKPLTTVESESNGADSAIDAVIPSPSTPSSTLCRFGESSLGTVPKTPVSGAKWKALKIVFGSPPGLSRSQLRRDRDGCKGPALTSASWGSCEDSPCISWTSKDAKSNVASTGSTASGKRHAACESLSRLRQEAARLKDLKSAQKREQVPASSLESEDDVKELSDVTGRRCRFDSTPLGTTPSTPVGGQVSMPSPPGLSRKAMREARDMCKTKSAAAVTYWGASMETPLTINPSANNSSRSLKMPR